MNILRWFLILPVSIFLSIFIPSLYDTLMSIFIPENSSLYSYIVDDASFLLQGLLFVVSFYTIAPKYKNKSLVVGLILWFLIVIIGEYYIQNKLEKGIGIYASFLRILGAVLAYINIKLESKKPNS